MNEQIDLFYAIPTLITHRERLPQALVYILCSSNRLFLCNTNIDNTQSPPAAGTYLFYAIPTLITHRVRLPLALVYILCSSNRLFYAIPTLITHRVCLPLALVYILCSSNRFVLCNTNIDNTQSLPANGTCLYSVYHK